ncbi:dolichyl-phosphate beta-glucosyltransferase [Desulforegula conservatrix]|uniref:dolichyl-phosphate beta-glucosyltransferase n=1 Tax=Desulforegula conservatrix TaxID=153026 RepID=UPI00041177D8|nr:dolichyl-phosphate beta-glucosyltransferase [Desulforegula conservatrix]
MLSIVIPAYNESDRIIPTIEKTLSYLSEKKIEAEIIVVSDGSKDATVKTVRSFSAPENVKIRAIEYFPNRGKGYAVKTGMLAAIGDTVMFMDADYSVPIEYLETAFELIKDGYDIAIASRAVEGSVVVRHQNFLRELSGKIYTLIQNTHLGLNFNDTQCGFKVFTGKTVKKLFSGQKLSSVIFDPEILWLACQYGFRTAEFPVKWTHMENSRIQYDSIDKFLFVFKELFRIKKLHR